VTNNCVWTVVEGNWAVLAKKNVWATYSDKARSKVRKGDRIAFYVKGTGNFRGIYRVSTDWYAASEPIWYDELAANKVIYKHQVAVELLELGSANYKALVHSLSFVKNKDEFQVYIQSMGGGPANHSRPISDEDLDVLAAELHRNPLSEEVPQVEEGSSSTGAAAPGAVARLHPIILIPWLFQDLVSVSSGLIDSNKYAEERDPPSIFEDLVFLAFRLLGYNTSRQLGYKRGAGRPGPDGEARSSIADYVIVYDAKQRADGYALSAADHRALRDYVEEVKSRGDRNVFCMIVSSSFNGDPRPLNGTPLVFLPADILLELVALKVQNPDIVNSRTLRRLFDSTRRVARQDVEQWATDHDADRLDLSRLLRVKAKSLK